MMVCNTYDSMSNSLSYVIFTKVCFEVYVEFVEVCVDFCSNQRVKFDGTQSNALRSLLSRFVSAELVPQLVVVVAYFCYDED